MDPTEGLKNEQTCILDEVFQASHQKEIIHQHSLTLSQFLLCPIKIKVDIQAHNKFCDGIFVGVGFLK